VLAWSIIGFALGNGILLPLIRWGLIPDFEGTVYLLFAVMGAVGGLLLGIGVRRRVVLVCLAGALGLTPGGLLAQAGLFEAPAAQAVWGAFAGGLLGLALQYRWRAILVAAAGALALPLRVFAGESLWSTPVGYLDEQVASVLIDVIIGGLVGLMLGLSVLLLERWRDQQGAQSLPGPAES
jgi:hypothetical protein